MRIDVRPGDSLVAVRDSVRALSAAEKAKGVEIVLADGEYRLDSPLELSAADSGTNGAMVVWRAANRTKAVITGATALEWRKPDGSDADRLALLPAAARPHVLVADIPGAEPLPSFLNGSHCYTPSNDIPPALFADAERLEFARWPDDGYARTGDVPKPGTFVSDAPRLAEWAKEPEPWTFGLWKVEWADLRTPLLRVDPEEKTLSISEKHLAFGMKTFAPYYAFNMFSELDRPGEWVLDRARRRVWLWPKGKASADIVLTPHIIAAKRAHDIVFEGIVFEKARKTAIQLEECRRVAVCASVVRRTCSWGVKVGGGEKCRVIGCDMYDLGEGGVRLSGGNPDTLEPAGHVADNNHIHHYGKVFYNYRQGVAMHGVGSRATHNLVHHSPHTGIYFDGNDHYVGYNVIHDTCQFNDDAGAIYVWQMSWVRRGGTIEHNLVHMTGKKPYPTNTEGIYLDDFTSDCVVRGNIVNRASLGLLLGGGQYNRVEGNVFVNTGRSMALASRITWKDAMAGADSRLLKGLVEKRALYEGEPWRSRYPHMLDPLSNPDPVAAHHAFGNVITGNLAVASGEMTRANWEVISNTTVIADNASVSGDPGFADYAGFDWSAAPGSPHRAVIEGAKFREMGLYESRWRVSPPVKFGEDISPAPEFGPPLAAPKARIDCQLVGELPDGVDACAENTVECSVCGWAKNKRLTSAFWVDPDPAAAPREYNFTFVPRFDAEYQFDLMGGGARTLYGDIRIIGGEPERPFGDAEIAASDEHRHSARAKVRKGVPVKVVFRARAE